MEVIYLYDDKWLEIKLLYLFSAAMLSFMFYKILRWHYLEVKLKGESKVWAGIAFFFCVLWSVFFIFSYARSLINIKEAVDRQDYYVTIGKLNRIKKNSNWVTFYVDNKRLKVFIPRVSAFYGIEAYWLSEDIGCVEILHADESENIISIHKYECSRMNYED